MYTTFASLITVAVLICYINHRFIKIPTTIALILGALLISIVSISIQNYLNIKLLRNDIINMVAHLNLHDLLMNGVLSFLLFAGALSINLSSLKAYCWEIASLTIVSTLLTTFIAATAIYYLIYSLGGTMNYIYCVLFGALISPTDTIAVLAIFKEVRTPHSIKTLISGESLFNDGVGLVLFLVTYEIVTNQNFHSSIGRIIEIFIRDASGGILYGFVIAYIISKLLKSITEQQLKILMSIAIVTAGYAGAQALAISAPLAMVTAGITIGHHYRTFERDGHQEQIFREFWKIIHDIINTVLFLIIGFEVLLLHFNRFELITALLSIPILLAARALSVIIPLHFFKKRSSYPNNTWLILTWGGMRGALAIALALSLPADTHRELILLITYTVVIFSIVIQGLTMKSLLKHCSN